VTKKDEILVLIIFSLLSCLMSFVDYTSRIFVDKFNFLDKMTHFVIKTNLVIFEGSGTKVETRSSENSETLSSNPAENPKNNSNSPSKSAEIIKREKLVTCNNYASMPTVICRGEGVYLYDVDGHKYFDFLSGFTSVNQGHCHPKIVKALTQQASVLHQTSRAFHSDLLVEYAEYVTKLFGYVSLF
jgi:hypothetical protein